MPVPNASFVAPEARRRTSFARVDVASTPCTLQIARERLDDKQLVLAVSEKTLLPVVIAAAPYAEIAPRLRVGIADVLRALRISREDIDAECAAMTEVVYGKTTNRQVLGILVDFAKALRFYLRPGSTLLEISLSLAETPCSPLFKTTVSPDRTTVKLFTCDRERGA